MNDNDYKAFRLQMLFGFTLLCGIMLLIALVGLGRVEEKSSYGLPDLIRILGYMGAGFIGWMAGKGHGGHTVVEPKTQNAEKLNVAEIQNSGESAGDVARSD